MKSNRKTFYCLFFLPIVETSPGEGTGDRLGGRTGDRTGGVVSCTTFSLSASSSSSA